MSKIAFIGLGNMGGSMSINLVKAGHEVNAYDLSVEALKHVSKHGVIPSESSVAAAVGADVVITMLPAGTHVEGVYVTNEALFDQLQNGALTIDCSTIDAETTKRIGKVAEEKGIAFVDAPVSGGTAGAAAGTLTFMVGGTEENFASAKIILQAMGSNVYHAGAISAGQITKACNNMMLGISMAGVVEALNMGIKNGLDPATLSEIMKVSSGDNWVLQKYNPVPGVMENVPAANNYENGFLVDLMCKDLGLAVSLSEDSQSPTPMGTLAKKLFELHQEQGNGRLDFSSIMDLEYKNAKAKIRL